MRAEFYGYKHWTLEEVPRCFYVGKGKRHRPFDDKLRSKKWHAVVQRHGLRVEVCFGPVLDREAIEWEITTIAEANTFTTSYSTNEGLDIGCNFTRGGDGASGYKHSDEFKRSVSQRCKGKPGKPHTLEARQKMSETRKGKPKPEGFGEKIGKLHRKPVQQLDECGEVVAEFESATIARNITGVSYATISMHCNGLRSVNGRPRWRFKPDAQS